jgi:hypothetical protein
MRRSNRAANVVPDTSVCKTSAYRCFSANSSRVKFRTASRTPLGDVPGGGGIDNGSPGLRNPAVGYPPGYYAAFVLDPDGNNMEAVFRKSEPMTGHTRSPAAPG